MKADNTEIEAQNKAILAHLWKGGTITQKEAVTLFDCLRLSARIFDLRTEGYNIETRRKTINKANGHSKTVAEYALIDKQMRIKS